MKFPFLAFLLISPGFAAPVINEVHYGPDDKTTETEFIEIHNPDASPLDLSGWAISGAVQSTFPSGTTLDQGQYLLVAENPTKLRSAFSIPTGVTVLAFDQFLGNTGEDILLIDDSRNTVDLVDYTNEFPWPTSASGDGPSIELLNPLLENDLGGSWRASLNQPTPGRINSTFTNNAPPQLRGADHSPQVPTDQDPIIVSIRASDSDGIGSLILSYQINAPGEYIPAELPLDHNTLINSPETPLTANPAFEDPANWAQITMTPDPAQANTFTATIPAQNHRTLVRYRVTATDPSGASVRAPAIDDPSRNFAAFVYNGVPDYTAANSVHPDGNGKVYSSALLTSLPVYTLLTRPLDLQASYAYPNTPFSGNTIAKGNRDARGVFNWQGAFVYDGIVYDHVRYRLRQNNNRFSARGKRSMRFRFNDGHYFQARDEEGRRWPVKWRSLNTGKMSTFSSATSYGIREVVNSRIWRMAGIECPLFYHVHLRVVDDAQEAPDQYEGDFFGLAMAFEDIDGRLLDARDLPDGNLYKFKDGEKTALELQRNQERFSVNNGSDFINYQANLNLNRTEAELGQMVDWDQWSLYHTVCEAIRHYDHGTASTHRKNQAWYFQPTPGSTFGRLRLIPHDHDATWSRGYHDNLRIGIGRDFPWRAIFSQSPTVGASDDRTPLKAPYNLIYRNTVRNFHDLFWNEETVNTLIGQTLSSIEEFTFPDRDRWLGGTPSSGIETAMGPPQGIVSGMLSIAFTNDLVDGESLDGGRDAVLDKLQEDLDIPDTPTITYDGPADFPPGQLSLTSSPFSDPQGTSSYASTQWRVAEVTLSSTLVANIFTTGTSWNYRDTGEDLGDTWRETSFNDSIWASGPSPLGYGESIIDTTITSGPNFSTRFITQYFRKDFNLTINNPDAVYRLRILRDDGAVIYLNGNEITRLGMAPGPVTYLTIANENATEGVFDTLEIPASAFNNGANTFAISLHQRTNTSSDTVLDVILDEFSPDSSANPVFEWDATWESGDTTANLITPPAVSTRTGRIYRARVRHLDSSGRPSHWSEPLQFVAGAVDASLFQDSIVISEFFVQPGAATAAEIQSGWDSSDFEFIRLKNISNQPIDLANLRFTKGVDLDLSGTLAPGAEITLARNPAAYLSRNSGAAPLGPWSGRLKNEGELLRLSFGAGEPVQEFTYFNSPAWPTSSSAVPFSLALIAPDLNPDHALPSSWRPVLASSPDTATTFTGTATDDLDGDGISALVEHALGTSDLIANGSPLVLDNGRISISRNLNAADTLLFLSTSTDLQDWQTQPDSTILSSLITADGSWIIDYEYDIELVRQFFRLNIETE